MNYQKNTKIFGGCSLLKIKLPIILSNQIKHNHDYFQRQSFHMFDGALKDDNSTKTGLVVCEANLIQHF